MSPLSHCMYIYVCVYESKSKRRKQAKAGKSKQQQARAKSSNSNKQKQATASKSRQSHTGRQKQAKAGRRACRQTYRQADRQAYRQAMQNQLSRHQITEIIKNSKKLKTSKLAEMLQMIRNRSKEHPGTPKSSNDCQFLNFQHISQTRWFDHGTKAPAELRVARGSKGSWRF